VGINEPVRLYELLDTAEHAESGQKERVAIFHEALDHFEKREWTQALSGFEKILAITADDAPSKMYYERSTEFIKNPPDDTWDGVYNLTSK
jgi:adenylate cyclase